MVVGLSTVIAVTGGFTKNQPETASKQQPQTQAVPAAAPAESPKAQASLATAIRPNRERKEEKQNKQEEKSNTETVAETKPAEEVKEAEPTFAIDQSCHADRKRSCVESVDREPKPGMNSYEALALRIARQRRYPPRRMVERRSRSMSASEIAFPQRRNGNSRP